MGPLLTAIIPSVVSAGASMIGGNNANAANARMAQQQMEFQKHMRATQYQTAVADMRKAGLNPALAYSQGGAGTPTGASAPMQNTLTGAADAAMQIAQLHNINAQTRQINVESAARVAELEARAEQAHNTANATKVNLDFDTFRKSLDNEFWETYTRGNTGRPGLMTGPRMQQALADIRLTQTNAREHSANALLAELEENAARAQSNTWRTWFGKYVRPYENDAKSLTGTIHDLIQMRGGFRVNTTDTETTHDLDAYGNRRGTFTRTRRY